MSEALKCCPFCGGEPRLVDLAVWEVHCDCGAQLWLPGPGKNQVIAAWNRRAPTSAAGATKPDELTSSPEPAPALRAAEWVETARKLANTLSVTRYALGAFHASRQPYDDQDNEAARLDSNAGRARDELDAHLSRASGLLPVAREGLSDEQIDKIWRDTPAQGDPTGKLFYRYFARAIEAAHGIAPASGDAPGEAK